MRNSRIQKKILMYSMICRKIGILNEEEYNRLIVKSLSN
jgi:hypothetical protein